MLRSYYLAIGGWVCQYARKQAAALVGMGEIDEGVRLLDRIVQKQPDHFLSHRLLGVVYHHFQKVHHAAKHLRQAEMLQPGDPEVTRLLHAMSF